jgi:hypothetical protein
MYAYKIWSIQEAITFLPPAQTLPGGTEILHGPPQLTHLAYGMFSQMGLIIKRVTHNDPDAVRGMLAHLKEHKPHMQAEFKRLEVLPKPDWRPADIPTMSPVNPLATPLPAAPA